MLGKSFDVVPDGRHFSFSAIQERSDLQSTLISFLGHEPGFDEIAQELAMDFLRGFESRWVHFARLRSDATLAPLGFFGLSAQEASCFEGVSIWEPWPMSIAARDGQIAVFGDGSDPTVMLPECGKPHPQNTIVVAAPLNLSIKTIGVLSIGFLPSDAPVKSLSLAAKSIAEILVLYLAGWLAPMDRMDGRSATDNETKKVVSDKPRSALSQRQLGILGLLAEGFTYDQIGNRIGFSHSTVRMELMQIYRTFGVKSRAEAVKSAHDLGLIPVDIPKLDQVTDSDNPGGVRVDP